MSAHSASGSQVAGAPGVAAAPGSGQLFARPSTGLVRELSTRDNVLLLISYISLPLGLLLITQVGAVFPGANVGVAFLVTLAVVLPHVVTYGLFSQAMPRSGGDYLFMSRALNPLWGYVINATNTLWSIFGAGFVILFIPTFALPALFQGLALSTGDAGWIDAATTVSKEGWQFAIGGTIAVGWAVLMIFGLRAAMRVFKVLVVVSLVGVAATLIALLFVSHDDFVSGFSRYGSVARVIAAAKGDGLDTSPALSSTLASALLLITTLGVAVVSSSWAGETRRASKSGLRGMLMALVGAGACLAAVAFLAQRAFHSDFLASAQFVSGGDAWPIDGPPFLNLFITIAAPHTWLVLLLGITFIAGVAAVGVPIYLFATRVVFAHAFERILPMSLASVSRRTHTPVTATVLVTVLMLAFMAGFIFVSQQFTAYLAASALLNLVIYASVGLAGAAFPFRQRAMYEASPIKRELLGLPLLTVVGAIDALLMITYLVVLLDSKYTDALGVTSHDAVLGLAVVSSMFTVIWIAAWLRSRQSGLSIARASSELPPE
jgi:amino acid transporter